MLWTKRFNQSANFQTFLNVLWWKFANFLMSFLKAQVSYPSNFSKYSVPLNITPLYFFSSSIIYFGQKRKFSRSLSAQVKIPQIPHVNFELTRQFLFNFCIISYTLVKSSSLSVNFWDFEVLRFLKFLMSILKRQVNSSSGFSSFFNVVTYNYSVNF